MEHKASLPCSKEPSTGPHPEQDESSPYHTIPSYVIIHQNIVTWWVTIEGVLIDNRIYWTLKKKLRGFYNS
jgi:hypothetical protein